MKLENPKPSSTLFRVTLFTALATLAWTAPPAVAGEEVVEDGTLHVRNGATPPEGREVLTLEEVWRAGGPDDEETLFGLIADVLGDEEGNIYILDAQLLHVEVYSPTGELLRTLFREGEGPGEVLRPRDIVMLPDGSVGAAQEFPGKVIVVDREGIPQKNIVPGADNPEEGGFLGLIAASCRGGNIVLTGMSGRPGERPGTQDRGYFIGSVDRDGKMKLKYIESTAIYDFTDFTFSETDHVPVFWWGYALGPDGKVYAPIRRDRYEIFVFKPEGGVDRIIEKEHTPRKRSKAEIEIMRRMFASAMSNVNIEVTFDVEETDPVVAYFNRGMRVAEDGSLWVLPSRGCREQPDGIMATYDVFNPEGHFVKEVAVECEGDGDHDALFFTGPNTVVLVKGYLEALAAMFGRGTPISEEGEEAQPMEVVCYRVTGSG